MTLCLQCRHPESFHRATSYFSTAPWPSGCGHLYCSCPGFRGPQERCLVCAGPEANWFAEDKVTVCEAHKDDIRFEGPDLAFLRVGGRIYEATEEPDGTLSWSVRADDPGGEE